MAEEVVLAGACRTAIGKFQGALSSFTAPQIGAVAVREAVRRSGVKPSDIQEVILGNVLQAGIGQNPARQAAIHGGIPDSVGAMTINKVCGSGLKAVALAVQAIRAGDLECALAGGMESMTNAPYLLPQARAGQRLGHGKLLDSMVQDGLWDAYKDFHMGCTAELVVRKYDITRQVQDEFAAESHRKAAAAWKAGKYAAEVVAVDVPQPKGPAISFAKDEGPREDSTVEKLGKLRAAFEEKGTVTPGNSSTINDGAAAVVVLSAAKARALGVRPIARVTGYAVGGMAPEWVMMAPLEAVKNLQAKTGMKPQDFDLVEINEAFSAASVALIRELKLDPARVNVHGGAVALGHPIGCSGTRILVTLLHALADRGQKKGLATLCLGGGNAVALSVEML
ncbi:MAG: acetyl-CoA C-acyltransferase [Planctomycetota bacterium]